MPPEKKSDKLAVDAVDACNLKNIFKAVDTDTDSKDQIKSSGNSSKVFKLPLPRELDKPDEGTIKVFSYCQVIQDPKCPTDVTVVRESVTEEVYPHKTPCSSEENFSNRYRYCKEVIRPYLKEYPPDCPDSENLLVRDAIDAANEEFPDYPPCYEVKEPEPPKKEKDKEKYIPPISSDKSVTKKPDKKEDAAKKSRKDKPQKDKSTAPKGEKPKKEKSKDKLDKHKSKDSVKKSKSSDKCVNLKPKPPPTKEEVCKQYTEKRKAAEKADSSKSKDSSSKKADNSKSSLDKGEERSVLKVCPDSYKICVQVFDCSPEGKNKKDKGKDKGKDPCEKKPEILCPCDSDQIDPCDKKPENNKSEDICSNLEELCDCDSSNQLNTNREKKKIFNPYDYPDCIIDFDSLASDACDQEPLCCCDDEKANNSSDKKPSKSGKDCEIDKKKEKPPCPPPPPICPIPPPPTPVCPPPKPACPPPKPVCPPPKPVCPPPKPVCPPPKPVCPPPPPPKPVCPPPPPPKPVCPPPPPPKPVCPPPKSPKPPKPVCPSPPTCDCPKPSRPKPVCPPPPPPKPVCPPPPPPKPVCPSPSPPKPVCPPPPPPKPVCPPPSPPKPVCPPPPPPKPVCPPPSPPKPVCPPPPPTPPKPVCPPPKPVRPPSPPVCNCPKPSPPKSVCPSPPPTPPKPVCPPPPPPPPPKPVCPPPSPTPAKPVCPPPTPPKPVCPPSPPVCDCPKPSPKPVCPPPPPPPPKPVCPLPPPTPPKPVCPPPSPPKPVCPPSPPLCNCPKPPPKPVCPPPPPVCPPPSPPKPAGPPPLAKPIPPPPPPVCSCKSSKSKESKHSKEGGDRSKKTSLKQNKEIALPKNVQKEAKKKDSCSKTGNEKKDSKANMCDSSASREKPCKVKESDSAKKCKDHSKLPPTGTVNSIPVNDCNKKGSSDSIKKTCPPKVPCTCEAAIAQKAALEKCKASQHSCKSNQFAQSSSTNIGSNKCEDKLAAHKETIAILKCAMEDFACKLLKCGQDCVAVVTTESAKQIEKLKKGCESKDKSDRPPPRNCSGSKENIRTFSLVNVERKKDDACGKKDQFPSDFGQCKKPVVCEDDMSPGAQMKEYFDKLVTKVDSTLSVMSSAVSFDLPLSSFNDESSKYDVPTEKKPPKTNAPKKVENVVVIPEASSAEAPSTSDMYAQVASKIWAYFLNDDESKAVNENETNSSLSSESDEDLLNKMID